MTIIIQRIRAILYTLILTPIVCIFECKPCTERQDTLSIFHWWSHLSKEEQKAFIADKNLVIKEQKPFSDLKTIAHVIYSLNNVKRCYISHNHIPSLNFIVMSFLTELSITHCQSSNIEFNNYFPFLTKLILAYNSIQKITADTFRLNKLQELDLSYNQIQTCESNAFKNCPQLKILDMSHNELANIQENCFNIPYLTSIDLSHNKIRSIDKKAFGSDNPVQEIDLSHNKLSFLVLEKMNALTTLWLSHNYITVLNRETVSNIPAITFLDISNNPIKGIDYDWPHFTNLAYLNISNNILNNTDKDIFRLVFSKTYPKKLIMWDEGSPHFNRQDSTETKHN